MRIQDLEGIDEFLEEVNARAASRILEIIVQQLDTLNANIASLTATVATVVAQDASLVPELEQAQADLAAAQAALADAPTADQVQAAAEAVAAADALLQAIVVPAPTPAFVEKIAGESYSDYQSRVENWNADPANPQVSLLDEASWDALPAS